MGSQDRRSDKILSQITLQNQKVSITEKNDIDF